MFESKQNDKNFCLDFFETTSRKLDEDEYYQKLHKYNRIKDESNRSRNIIHLEKKFSKKYNN